MGRSLSKPGLSVFDSTNKQDQELGRKIFSQLANYDRLRDPSEWGIDNADVVAAREEMCAFSAEPIPTSMTQLPQELEKDGQLVFQDLLRRMGDTPDISNSDKDEPIERAVHKDLDLCDEVYCQLLKQLNSNPSTWSVQEGFDVFETLLDARLPSMQLRDFIRGFLQEFVAGYTQQSRPRAPSGPPMAGAASILGARGRATTKLNAPRKSMRRPSAVVTPMQLQDNYGKMASSALEKFLKRMAEEEEEIAAA